MLTFILLIYDYRLYSLYCLLFTEMDHGVHISTVCEPCFV